MKKNLIILSMLVLGIFMFSMVSAGWFDLTGNVVQKFEDSADVDLKEGALTQIELDGEEVSILAIVIEEDSATINIDGKVEEISKGKSKRIGNYIVKLVTSDSSFWRRDKSRIEVRNLQEFDIGDDGSEEDEDLTVYPVPFIFEGLADVAIIYGTEPDISMLELVEAGNIQSDLFGYLEIIDGAPGNIIYSSDELSGNVDINFIDTNFIVIGSYCSNSAMWELLDEDSCEDVWDNEIDIEPGEFLIESFSNPFNEEKIMLYVVGYGVEEVVNAAGYLRNANVDTSVGARIVLGTVEIEEMEVTYQGVLNMLNSAVSYENMENGDFSCNDICVEQDLICIKADIAYYSEVVSRWIVDTGATCDMGFAGLVNVPEQGNHKLQCLCSAYSSP